MELTERQLDELKNELNIIFEEDINEDIRNEKFYNDYYDYLLSIENHYESIKIDEKYMNKTNYQDFYNEYIINR